MYLSDISPSAFPGEDLKLAKEKVYHKRLGKDSGSKSELHQEPNWSHSANIITVLDYYSLSVCPSYVLKYDRMEKLL